MSKAGQSAGIAFPSLVGGWATLEATTVSIYFLHRHCVNVTTTVVTVEGHLTMTSWV